MKRILLCFGLGLIVAWACLFGFFKIQSIMNPYAPPEPFGNQEPDLERSPNGAGITYSISINRILETSYQIVFGGCRKDDLKGPPWDFYYIWISKESPHTENGWYPFYIRWADATKVGAQYWTNDVANLYSFNADLREVVIDFGITNYSCILPADWSNLAD